MSTFSVISTTFGVRFGSSAALAWPQIMIAEALLSGSRQAGMAMQYSCWKRNA